MECPAPAPRPLLSEEVLGSTGVTDRVLPGLLQSLTRDPSAMSTQAPLDNGLSGSTSAEEVASLSSPSRKLKLKVSRGALAKGRGRRSGASSQTSSDSRSSVSGPLHEEANDERSGTQPPQELVEKHAPTTPASRRWRKHLNKSSPVPQSPTTPAEILALFSGDSNCVNGKALRRLKRRFPDLEVRLAEVQVPFPEQAASADTSGQEEEKPTEAGGFHRGRLRGRVSRWMKRAGRVIARARAGSGEPK